MSVATAPSVPSAWTRTAGTNPVAGAIDTILRGTGQVMFQNNPLTGLLFMVGIWINSVKLGWAALLGVVVSTATAYLLGVDRSLIRNGLFGFNGVLLGIALAFFLVYNPLLIAYIVFGAIITTVVMAALANLLAVWNVPALTAPFVVVAWMMLFAVYVFAHVRPTPLIAPVVLDPSAAVLTELRQFPFGGVVGATGGNLGHAVFRGFGEVMFQDNFWTGLIFLVAILVNSPLSALFALVGSILGMLTGLALGGEGIAIWHGLYGFNAVLTAIALGGLFVALTWRSVIYMLIAVIFSTVVFAALSVFLAPIGMPALTAPFVLTTWLFLLARGAFPVLREVQLADVTTVERIRASFAQHPDRGPAVAPEPRPPEDTVERRPGEPYPGESEPYREPYSEPYRREPGPGERRPGERPPDEPPA
jgi:urea transporter